MGPKKGVISQSVKDVIQSLVDDDLVAKDKIGISVSSSFSPSCLGSLLAFYMLFNGVDYYAYEGLLLEPSQLCRQSGDRPTPLNPIPSLRFMLVLSVTECIDSYLMLQTIFELAA